jgi:hypothetical protein
LNSRIAGPLALALAVSLASIGCVSAQTTNIQPGPSSAALMALVREYGHSNKPAHVASERKLAESNKISSIETKQSEEEYEK